MRRKTFIALILVLSGLMIACAHRSGHRRHSKRHVTSCNKGGNSVTKVVKVVGGVEAGGRKSVPELLKCACDGNNYVWLERDGYVSVYNLNTHCPMYVGWKLTFDRVDGEEPRCKIFFPDEELVEEHRVQKNDYSGSGWSRGHMCPAADNKDSRLRMEESCLMTNICPQDMGLNNGRWNDLEERCRKMVRGGDVLYIICGPIFSSEQCRWIGNDVLIAVPDGFYKVMYVEYANGNHGMLAYVFPNEDVREKIDEFRTTVDSVEEMTGLDFFSVLPDEEEELLESSY